MAKAKSGSFYIRRTVDCSANTPNVVALDTSAYVDPADRQGLMIESVDFVFYNSGDNLPLTGSGDERTAVQLLTGTYSDMQPYDNEDIVASAGLITDGAAGSYNAVDLYPDLLGTNDGRIVVDDQMSIIGESASTFTAARCALVIKAKVVTLTNKDYMALALQTVAN